MSRAVYYRLIALWVLNEALLGGIIHGFRIPISGLVVGSAAVICICLIAWYVPEKGAILKATIVVAIFKMMLSPQAPLPAYIAVLFQGFLGELLFNSRKYYRFFCVLFAILALLESAIQRVLVLTVIYSNDIWEAINKFINGLTKQDTPTNYSLLIVASYIGVHLITGALIGWWASVLPSQIKSWSGDNRYKVDPAPDQPSRLAARSQKKKRIKWGLLVIWVILIGLYVQSYYNIGTPVLPANSVLKIILRSFIILMAWYFVVGPLLHKALLKWLTKKKSTVAKELEEVVRLLPSVRALVYNAWKQSAIQTGVKRILLWMRMVMVNALQSPSQVVILTGPIRSGKTTSLIKWSQQRNAEGILTPVIDGKRVFMVAGTGEPFAMEAADNEKETVSVGKFEFSQPAFDRAVNILRQSVAKPGWLVIDEIGPLELRGEGFAKVMKEVLSKQNGNILLVVRDGLVENVQQYFKLTDSRVIHRIEEADIVTEQKNPELSPG